MEFYVTVLEKYFAHPGEISNRADAAPVVQNRVKIVVLCEIRRSEKKWNSALIGRRHDVWPIVLPRISFSSKARGVRTSCPDLVVWVRFRIGRKLTTNQNKSTSPPKG